MTFGTNFGNLCFNAWDQQHGKPRDGFYIQGQCAIIVFDLSSRASYEKVPMWYNSITQVCGDIPIVLCGNKADIQERKVQQNENDFHRHEGYPVL
ncbi:GTP-binding nuclear protein gsp1/Ran [Linnemannia gamsii]|uniref:GTP-binding nuclear protein gsp1/Ran n=1 Tax=Linnemannia gamsii TaxID=64522 RepID=A0A9P6RD51_9FUNG|nr:GTP-binding nuclear protein gsp1/Ran [Linnemannia gamsii]